MRAILDYLRWVHEQVDGPFIMMFFLLPSLLAICATILGCVYVAFH